VYRVLDRSGVTEIEELLLEVFRDGRRTAPSPSLEEMRALRVADLERLDAGVRRLVNPHIYHVSLTDEMKQLQLRLVREARGR
jgi:nicotinate phosphoribosyltransferase